MSYFTRTSNPLLTILLPSRNRFDMCINTINSFADTCIDKSNLEIIIKFDTDDESSLSRIDEIRKDVNIKYIISDRLRGYFSLHHFCNEMLKQSTGDWILMVNDDSLMTTHGWDVLLEKVSPLTHKSIHGHYSGSDKHLPIHQRYNKFEGNNNLALLNLNLMNAYTTTFPVVRRSVCDKLGYFTLHPHNDAFLNDVYHRLHASLNVPEIKMRHLCNEVSDQTRKETAAAQGSSMNDFSYGVCEQTAIKIKELLDENCHNSIIS
jgi:hypothetical protein